MFEGFKPSASEKRYILAALHVVYAHARSEYEVDQAVKAEKRGYGNKNDALPLIAAQGLVAKWFLAGVNKPDALLRDTFTIRPSAIYAQGLGAREAFEGRITPKERDALQAGFDAYETAFNRMMSAQQ